MAGQGDRGQRAREIIARIANRSVEDLDDSETLGDLGLDSLDAIDVNLAIEEATGIDLGDEVDGVTPAMTIGEVIAKAEAASLA